MAVVSFIVRTLKDIKIKHKPYYILTNKNVKGLVVALAPLAPLGRGRAAWLPALAAGGSLGRFAF